MWRLFVLAFLTLLIFGAFYDLKYGTLPRDAVETNAVSETHAPKVSTEGTYVYYIKTGDSVLSVVKEHEGELSVSMETIIYDFINLNGGADPSALVVGNSYIFKDY